MSKLTGIKIFSGNSNPALSQKISDHIGVPLGKVKTSFFADGETRIQITESLRNEDVYVIQSASPPVNDSLMELFILMDSLKRASAKTITVVLPYCGYLRQDKKVQPREPITAKLIADFITCAGANRVMIVDPHFEQFSGFFNIPVDILYGGPILGNYFKELGVDPETDVVVAPDVGGTARASFLAKMLGLDFIVIDKKRSDANQIASVKVVGEVNSKNCILTDDLADTLGTLLADADALKEHGANNIYACVSHALLNREADKKILTSNIDKFICLDTIPIPEEKQNEKIEILSSAKLISDAIRRHHTGESVSALFEGYR